MKYLTVTIDLTTAHTDEPLGIKSSGVNYRFLRVLKRDSAFTFKLNYPTSDDIDARLDMELSEDEIGTFIEIYYSNDVGTGEGKFLLGY